MLKGKKVIVTGGAGFIGSHLVDRLLREESEIVVIDNFSTGRESNLDHAKDQIKIVEADISVLGEWKKFFEGAHTVFHLAALADIVPSIENPEDYFSSNVRGTFNIAEICRDYSISKVIYSASSSCYGIPKNFPTCEDEKTDPRYPYALTKYLGEQIIMHWSKLYKIPSISLRFFNVYGTRSRTSGTYGAVFGVFLAQKLAGKPFTVVGDGSQTRDFTFVSDIIEAIIQASLSDFDSEILNVGSGSTYSVNHLVDLLEGEKVYIPRRPGEPDCTWADISRIKDKLNWNPKISLENGVGIILENIDYWKEAPVWEPKSISKETSSWFRYLKDE